MQEKLHIYQCVPWTYQLNKNKYPIMSNVQTRSCKSLIDTHLSHFILDIILLLNISTTNIKIFVIEFNLSNK